jgi:hypothetical protein
MNKTPKSFLAIAVASLFLATFAFAASEAKQETPVQPKTAKCCAKAAEDGKACTHPCCVEAAKAGDNCTKCQGAGKIEKKAEVKK